MQIRSNVCANLLNRHTVNQFIYRQTNNDENNLLGGGNEKIQITTVCSTKVKTFFVNTQHTVLSLSCMMQGYRKNTILQCNTTNVNNHNIQVEK